METCFDQSDATDGGTCSDTAYQSSYCAYHTDTYDGLSPVVYANMTFPTDYYYGCLSDEAPNGNTPADSVIDSVSHEWNEAVTDPTGQGWIDGSGNEMADECAWTFGPQLGGATGAGYDQTIGSGHYYLQEEFSNADYAVDNADGCVASEGPPVASFDVVTPVPVPGNPVSLDGAASSDYYDPTSGITGYSWNFGDGSGDGSGVAPSHVYSSPGPYSVSLTVTDGSGLTGTVSHVVTVESPGAYRALAPVRICDTRAGNPSGLVGAAAQCDGVGGAGSRLSAGSPVDVVVGGSFGVPAGATAVVMNVTAIGATAPGYLTVYPGGAELPGASSLNFTAGRSVPNLVESGVGGSGEISVVANTAVDVVVDLEGYVSSGGTPGAGLYNPLAAPARICDTRSGDPSGLTGGDAQCGGVSGSGERLPAGSTFDVTVGGNGGVPATGVSAVVLNVTVVDPGGPGYLTAFPEGTAVPTASNVNFAAWQTHPNRVVVPLSATGQISLVADQATDVLVDVSGWYSANGGTGAEFTPEEAPVRICDTRAGNPSGLAGGAAQCNGLLDLGEPLLAGGRMTLTVAGLAGVPSDASAVVVNVTAVRPSLQTFLAVFPSGSPPDISDLNPGSGATEANLTVATISPGGTVVVYNNAGLTNLVVDVTGWYS